MVYKWSLRISWSSLAPDNLSGSGTQRNMFWLECWLVKSEGGRYLTSCLEADEARRLFAYYHAPFQSLTDEGAGGMPETKQRDDRCSRHPH